MVLSAIGEQPQNNCYLSLAEAAILAPSPDNNQPWHFVSRGDGLWVYLDSARALPSDVNGMFDLIGVGAAIENAVIRARQSGWELAVRYEHDAEQNPLEGCRLVATLRRQAAGHPDPLEPFLKKRCTCRKRYATSPVEASLLERLRRSAERFSAVDLEWIADRRRIRAFARMVTSSDRFRFQYEPFHEEIFRQLRFTAGEAEETRDGLDIRTLELPAGAATLIRWLRPWPRMRRLQQLGLDRLLTLPSGVSVRGSGALGVLTVPEPGSQHFLEAGRAFQRLWLAATEQGLCLHPLGSLPVLLAHWEQLAGKKLHAGHQKVAEKLGTRLRDLVPSTRGRTLAMLFRIGHCQPPSYRSLRRPIQEVLKRTESTP